MLTCTTLYRETHTHTQDITSVQLFSISHISLDTCSFPACEAECICLLRHTVSGMLSLHQLQLCVTGSSPRTIKHTHTHRSLTNLSRCTAVQAVLSRIDLTGQLCQAVPSCAKLCQCVWFWVFIQHAGHSVRPWGINVKLWTMRSRVAWRCSRRVIQMWVIGTSKQWGGRCAYGAW